MNEKFDRFKKKLKKHAPEVIGIVSTVAATAGALYAIKVVNSSRAIVAKAREDMDELTTFLGNGPDFVAFNEELANKIDDGEVYEYSLSNGVRIAIMKALKD